MSARETNGLRKRNRGQGSDNKNLPAGWKRIIVGFKVMLQGPQGLVPDDGLPPDAYGSANDQQAIPT
jgi:hypothetical protein